MSEEEKKALKDCDIIFMCLEDMMSEESANDARKSYKIIRNLIENQQKEIEELNKSDESKEQSSMKYYNLYRELVDKIKAKIEEYKKQQKEEPDAYLCIKALSSLLEKE